MLKLDFSVDEGIKGVILADADIFACVNRSAALSDNDIARNDSLTVSLLDAKALGLTVSAVLGGTDALLVSKEL